MEKLGERVVRGGIAKLCGQAAGFVLRLGFTAAMARLLHPEDFGLVAMVVAVTGIFDLFTNAGLSLATVQKSTITEEQISSLFWVNLFIGFALCLICFAMAPLLVKLYNEPRLFWITIAIGSGFLFNAAGVQHSALLQRQLRYADLTVIELISLLLSYSLGIILAVSGLEYWALVAAMITLPTTNSALMWIVTAWIPQLPKKETSIRPLLAFGGTITLNNLIVYLAYNLDKLLIGRFWGPFALGLYGTAYQLINVPTRNLTAAVGSVAFSALARLQEEPVRMKYYFLKGYSLLISITAPITIFSALFAEDIVLVVLGHKWADATGIFRLLAPTILVLSIINPTGWLLQSTGLHGRSLRIGLVLAPIVIAGYLIGLPHGPKGVALGFSAAMVTWVIPHVIWCMRGTIISATEFFLATLRPFVASIVAAVLTLTVVEVWLDQANWPLFRLGVAGSIMAASYLSILLLVLGEKALYLDLLRHLRSSSIT